MCRQVQWELGAQEFVCCQVCFQGWAELHVCAPTPPSNGRRAGPPYTKGDTAGEAGLNCLVFIIGPKKGLGRKGP